MACEVGTPLFHELEQRRGDEQRVDHPVEPPVTPALHPVEEEQDFRRLQVRVFREDERRQLFLPGNGHLLADAGKVVQVLNLDAEPDDGDLRAIARCERLERGREAQVGARFVLRRGGLQVGREKFQKLLGGAVALAHVSDSQP